MGAGEFLKTTKGKVISIGGVSVVAVGIAAAVLMQGDGYRSISVEQVSGTVSVVGEKNNGQAYVGEHLYSGDDVTVGDASELTMCMDNDKYVYADANTHFNLQASAANEDSKIKIYLDAGSELNDLQTSLAEGETYEVDTPNSTMSVRGTKFRVTVYKGKDGNYYTLVEVTEGEVLVKLKTTDGSYNGVEKSFLPGQSALIRGNSSISEFVTSTMLKDEDLSGDSGDTEVLMLSYDTLPKGGLDRLIELLENSGLEEGTEETPLDEKAKESEFAEEPATIEAPETDAEDTADASADEEAPTPLNSLRSVAQQQRVLDAVVGTDPETGALILRDGTLFDPEYYAQANPDVVKNFGSDTESLLNHYLTFGQNENRPASLAQAREQEEKYQQFASALAEEEEQTSSGGGSGSSSSSSSGTQTYSQQYINNLTQNGTYYPTDYVGYNGHHVQDALGSNGTPLIYDMDTGKTTINGTQTVNLPQNLNSATAGAAGSQIGINYPKEFNWDDSVVGATSSYMYGNTVYNITKTGTNTYSITETDTTPGGNTFTINVPDGSASGIYSSIDNYVNSIP